MSEIVYLGPEGTYSHEVARKRYGYDGHTLKGMLPLRELCKYVSLRSSRKGVVPIVNSSGGLIHDTVDALLDEDMGLHIEEEISINIKLALMGHSGEKIKTIYSHFAPLRHCEEWIEKKYRGVEIIAMDSTAEAVKEAANHPNSVAIGNKQAASFYNMDILEYPFPAKQETNVTQFLVIGKKRIQLPRATKTSIAVQLLNNPGALCEFLKVFADAELNLSGIASCALSGDWPREYAFLIDIDQGIGSAALKDALRCAKKHASRLRILGSYPTFREYNK